MKFANIQNSNKKVVESIPGYLKSSKQLGSNKQLEVARALFGYNHQIQMMVFGLNGVLEMIENVYNKATSDNKLKSELFSSAHTEEEGYQKLSVIEVVNTTAELIRKYKSFIDNGDQKQKDELNNQIKTINFNYKFRQQAIDFCFALGKEIKQFDSVIDMMVRKHFSPVVVNQVLSSYKNERSGNQWIELIGNHSQKDGYRKIHSMICQMENDQGKSIESILEMITKIKDLQVKAMRQRDILVTSNSKLVIKIASQLTTDPNSLNDNVQEGLLGLIHATNLFNPYMGNRFITFAYYWISQNILDFWHANAGIVNIPRRIRHQYRKIDILMNKHKAFGLEGPATEYVAKKMKMSHDDLLKVLRSENAIMSKEGSSSSLLERRKDGEDLDLCRLDLIPDGTMAIQTEMELEERNAFLDKVYQDVSPKEKVIWDLRLSDKVSEKMSLSDFKERTPLGVSGERVRQIESKLISKISQGVPDEYKQNG